jgi:anti-sigma factor RsiW
MECEQMSTWIDAYIDLELEPERAAELVAHARSCARCAASVLERQRLRSSLIAGMPFHPAPRETVRAVESVLARERMGAPRATTPRWAWASLAASLLLAGALAWSGVAGLRSSGRMGQPDVVREAVSSHIRSLMGGGGHLADVAASDQHTVKPWFAGKLEFSPRVADFAAEGFPLVGGRLDYVAGRPAAAVVYKRNSHVINLMSCADAEAKGSAPQAYTDRGYHAMAWTEPGFRFCAVSDVNEDELRAFVQLASGKGLREQPVP